MKNHRKKILELGTPLCIAILFISTSTIAIAEVQERTTTVEYSEGMTELLINGPFCPIRGIHAEIKNIGEEKAENVSWRITATGGILNKVNCTCYLDDLAVLDPDASSPIGVGPLPGFGRINIVITAQADNAAEVTTENTAFYFGKSVLFLINLPN